VRERKRERGAVGVGVRGVRAGSSGCAGGACMEVGGGGVVGQERERERASCKREREK
jgi:hypothetical protein